jgi:hypothetical protein
MTEQHDEQLFEWAIEDTRSAQPHLYLEHCAAMAAAVMLRRSESPCALEVACQGFSPPALRGDDRFVVRVSWSEETAAMAARVLRTEQRGPIVERGAVALAALLFGKLIPGGEMRVTRSGERADYWLPGLGAALEVSGTERLRELERRHREKAAQVLRNPLGWPGYAVVCCFGATQRRIIWSYHEAKSDREPN